MIINKLIQDFNWGMTPMSQEKKTLAIANFLKIFDAHTFGEKPRSFQKFESGDDVSPTTSREKEFLWWRWVEQGRLHSLYALGVKSGATNA